MKHPNTPRHRLLWCLAPALLLAMHATAAVVPSLSAPDITITRADVGKVIEVPITLTMPEGGNFTNIEFRFQFPNGLIPIADEDGDYCFLGSDIPTRKVGLYNVPVLSLSDNFEVTEFWPNFAMVGANLSKTPITTNPCYLASINVTPTENFTEGERDMTVYCAYSTYDDETYRLGYNYVDSQGKDVYVGVKLNTFKFTAGVAVTGITLPGTLSLTEGDTYTFAPVISPSDASDKSVTWATSNPAVATVDVNGKVTAAGVGTATITCTANGGNGVSATCQVTVNPATVAVTRIDLPATLSMSKGEVALLTPTITPTDATNQAVEWRSSNPAVAEVDAEGTVTAVGEGTAAITCTAQDGSGVSATCQVTVTRSVIAVTAPDLTVRRGDAGRVIALPLTLTMPAGGDFTNIQLMVTFPAGLKPCADADGDYGYGGDDLARNGKGSPYTAFSDNFYKEDLWPNYDVVGVNMSKTPNTANPCHFYTMNVTVDDATFADGDRDVLIYAKYTDYNDRSYLVGSEMSRVRLCTVHFTSTATGDANGDGVVDIDDVNAIVNILLKKNEPQDYSGNVDVTADGLVDIDDVNAIVNIMLRRV